MNKQYFLNKLKKKRPEVFSKYNYDQIPEHFLANTKLPIICKIHGLFHQRASSHLFSSGCIKCGIEKNADRNRLTTEEFIRRSKEKYGNKFDYSRTEWKSKGHSVIVGCPRHGFIKVNGKLHFLLKHGCTKCGLEQYYEKRKKKTLERLKEVQGDRYDYSKVNYLNQNTPVEIICRKHGSFWQKLGTHLSRKTGCGKCAKENNKSNATEFIEKAKKVHGDRYDYSKVDYVECGKKVLIGCQEHGFFYQRAQSHLDGCKCKKCFIEESKASRDNFIQNAKMIHGDRYDYSKVVYLGNKKPVEILCPLHGSFWQKPNSHVSSRAGCARCRESLGERQVAMVLEKYGIDFIREYKIKPHLYRYDFYLPKFNLFIEFNGQQHYMAIDAFGGTKALLGTKVRDKIKADLVKSVNGELIILTYHSLSKNTIEQDLIKQLKRVRRYWLLINEELHVFRKITDIYRYFNIPGSVLTRNVFFEVKKVVSDLKELF